MKLKHYLGVGLRDAVDGSLRALQERYHISRKDARTLLADALIRTAVWTEIEQHCDWQLDKEANE